MIVSAKFDDQDGDRIRFSRLYPLSYLILLLLFIVLLNILLTMWIVVSLNFHKDGVALKHTSGGRNQNVNFHIGGDLIINDTLYARAIEGLQQVASFDRRQTLYPISEDSPFVVEFGNKQDRKLVISDQHSANSITFVDNNIEIKSTNWQTINSEKSSRQSIRITGSEVSIEEEESSGLQRPQGGFRLATLNTTSIQSDIFHNMRIESRTERITVRAEKEEEIRSNSGNVELNSYDDLLVKGEAHLDSRNVFLLDQQENSQYEPGQQPTPHHWRHKHHHHHTEPIAYQVCLCSNGKLFAASVHRVCQAGRMVCAD